MDTKLFESRKRDHIEHSLNPTTQAAGLSNLSQYRLVHDALPELDFENVSLQSYCLGKPSANPFYVPGMTAGHRDGHSLNDTLASVCEQRGWAMGLGSQRRDLEAPEEKVDDWKKFRARYPKLVVFGNLGISQLGVNRDGELTNRSIDAVKAFMDTLEPQGLCIHLNALQEVMQPEGTPQFSGGIAAVEKYTKELGIPIVLKETGCGFSRLTLQKIRHLELGAIDVSGLGGTHWGRIEGLRAEENSKQAIAAQTFAEWGVPTAVSVRAVCEVMPQTEVWASGGVRSGLDAAKLIALGATRVGMAKPALSAALQGEKALDVWMEQQEFELKVALFCTGSAKPEDLRGDETKIWKTTAN